jgi:hypothetical protein
VIWSQNSALFACSMIGSFALTWLRLTGRLLSQRGAGQGQPGFEHVLHQRLGLLGLGRLVALLEAFEVAPVIEDLEMRLVLVRSEQIQAQPRAASDHLPELDVRVHGLGEHQVDDLRHVDARIEHVHRDGDRQVGVRARAFEVVDQFFGPRIVGVDHAAEVAAVLRVQLVEQILQQDRVFVVAGEDDRLAQPAALGHSDAVFHQVAEDDAVGMHGLIALDAQRVQFRHDDARHGRLERRIVQQIDQIGPDQAGQLELMMDELGGLFAENARSLAIAPIGSPWA